MSNLRKLLYNFTAKHNLFYHSKTKQFQRNISSWHFVLALAFSLAFFNHSQAQVSENFENGIPSTWTQIRTSNANTQWSATTNGYNATNAVSVNPALDNIGQDNTAQYFLVTPQFTVPENGEIHFYTKQGNEADLGATYEVRLSTATQPDINGFNTTLQTYTESNLNLNEQTEYEKKVIKLPELPAGFQVYLAFVAKNTQTGATPSGDEWFIDDFAVVESCPTVDDTTISISDITVSEALVEWTHPSANQFEIQILPQGGTPAESGIQITGTSYQLENLDSNTEFDIYLSAICDNSSKSTWTGPVSFKTLRYGMSCDYPIELTDLSTPYVLEDNLSNWVNNAVTYTTAGSNCITGSGNTNYLNGDKVFIAYTPEEDGLINLTQTTLTGGNSTNQCYNGRSSLLIYDGCENVGVSCLAGVITTEGFTPATIKNFLVEAGNTYMILVSSELISTAGICFNLEIKSAPCAPPNEITYHSLTKDSITLSWDNEGGFANSWEYAIVPSGSGAPTSGISTTSNNTNNVINTGLQPGTAYDFYIRSVCDQNGGDWREPFAFTTQCETIDGRYTTNFATATNDTPEACWTVLDANNDGTTWNYIGGYPTILTETAQNQNHDYFVSPRLHFDGTAKQLLYSFRATRGISSYTVKLSTTGIGVENFTTTLVPETQISNTSFQSVLIEIPEDIVGDVNIAFVVQPNTQETAFRFAIDDVTVENVPTCPVPTNLFSLNVTETSAWLFWTKGGSETQWELVVQEQGTGEPTGSGILVSQNAPYMLTDLEPGTRYEFYVRAYCADNDQSFWVGPSNFQTTCVSYDTPFVESFDDTDENTQKYCWQPTGGWAMTNTHTELSGSDKSSYLITPAITIEGAKQLSFKYRAEKLEWLGSVTPARHGLEVLMSTTNSNPSSFNQVIVPGETFSHSGYIEKSVIIEGNGTIFVAFKVPEDFSGSATVLNIDDVSITDAPPCPIPSNLNLESLGHTTASFSWTTGYQEEAWNVVVQEAGGQTPANGEGIAVTSTTYTAENLTPDTAYEFYVQSVCTNNGTSEWFGPLEFKTSCSPITTPFFESFDSDSQTESCWTVIDQNGDLDTWDTDNAFLMYEGDQSAAVFTGKQGQTDDWLISPTITITENQRLRYYYRVYDDYYKEDLEILLSTNGPEVSQFTTVLYDSNDDPIDINNTEYKVKVINFPEGITGDINIAFHIPYAPTGGPSKGQMLLIDNVFIEDADDCTEPTNITTVNITDTTIEATWENNGSEGPWEIAVLPEGEPAPTGDVAEEYLYQATTNPFTITGLTASTIYNVYVRSVCSDTFSAWSDPLEVITKCPFDNLCQYTFVLSSDYGLSSELQISQNNQITQTLYFGRNQEQEEFIVNLCNGTEFSAYFWTIGSNAEQYQNFKVDILDHDGNLVYSSPESGMTPKRTIYSGMTICGEVACPQPTDLTASATTELSWTPAGDETQWEVAIQPLNNGTVPQSGILVSSPSYIPTEADYRNTNAATYEYFVRAVCNENESSYWAGPYVFVRNDDASTAINLPINDSDSCIEMASEITFINASVSPEAMSCEGENQRDVWFNFTAKSSAHIFEIKGFQGNFYYTSGEMPFPSITMTLYKDLGNSLEEIVCTYDNVLVAMHASKLISGENYKMRLTLNSDNEHFRTFNLCATTPSDLCDFNFAVNGGFEEPVATEFNAVRNITSLEVVPGWRQNLSENNYLFMWLGINAPGFHPYEGGQCVQLTYDENANPSAGNITGLYRDFDTSEITLLEYSFRHYTRFEGGRIELWAGPKEGPYALVTENLGGWSWELISGAYQVPEGQDTTRFIFRAAESTETIGNLLDDVRVYANNQIVSAPSQVDCTDPVAQVSANGTGTWIASEDNPGEVLFEDANSNTTTISGFTYPGTYTFTWQTSHCAYQIEMTYNGIADSPEVQSPIDYCLGQSATPLSANATDGYSLVWYQQAVGGTGSSTAPTPDTSVEGTFYFYVAYADAMGCEGPRAEIAVNVNNVTPELQFSYNETCASAENPMPILIDGFATGGTFSSSTLSVDPETGEVDLSTATMGTHEVTYTYSGDSTTCTSSGSYTASITITEAIAAITEFAYPQDTYCILEPGSVSPILSENFTTGGSFSSETLAIDAATGAITMDGATPGTHTVTYTFEGVEDSCYENGSFSVTIEVLQSSTPITEFSYANNLYCAASANALPIPGNGFTSGGTFTADSGLDIDPLTGEINIANSAMGNYTVSYTIAEDLGQCRAESSSSFDLTVLDGIDSAITGDCNGEEYWLTANTLDEQGISYAWTDTSGNLIGSDKTFNVTQYATAYNLTPPFQIALTVTLGDCEATTAFTVERTACKGVPRGISPDGNGKNDSLDLTGYGVNTIYIYNRNGRLVYEFKGNYTNQWHGQTNDGNELPDATYFYSVLKEDGSSESGWIYINRAH
ncbi:choice-of-anchor J domain-containing protein [Formosa sp. A9]|uniref:choice-of-anchor J domain-containing protein n=1 Tax=Formosa sp. A9 TaxID=3442641 RepID=UPI003EBB4666